MLSDSLHVSTKLLIFQVRFQGRKKNRHLGFACVRYDFVTYVQQ